MTLEGDVVAWAVVGVVAALAAEVVEMQMVAAEAEATADRGHHKRSTGYSGTGRSVESCSLCRIECRSHRKTWSGTGAGVRVF